METSHIFDSFTLTVPEELSLLAGSHQEVSVKLDKKYLVFLIMAFRMKSSPDPCPEQKKFK